MNFLYVGQEEQQDEEEVFYPSALKWFEWGRHPAYFRQVKAWKNIGKVDLALTGGHDVEFDKKRIYPIKFLTKHYPLRSNSQANRKIYKERFPRIEKEWRDKGWHVHYDHLRLVPELKPWREYELLNFSENAFGAEFLVERISGIGIEQTERAPLNLQTQALLETELMRQLSEGETLQGEVAERVTEVEKLKVEITERTARGEELKREIALQAAESELLQDKLSQKNKEYELLQDKLSQKNMEYELSQDKLSQKNMEYELSLSQKNMEYELSRDKLSQKNMEYELLLDKLPQRTMKSKNITDS